MDRRFELNRKAAHPDKVSTWTEVPSAIRNWERALVQWEHMSGHVMDQTTRMQTLTSLLPATLKERVTSQLRPDLDYTGMREYVLAQVTREEGRTQQKKEAKKEEMKKKWQLRWSWMPLMSMRRTMKARKQSAIGRDKPDVGCLFPTALQKERVKVREVAAVVVTAFLEVCAGPVASRGTKE